ncbi:tRNA (5-methylaminomethyl-2-thiouridine)(34)-methyltransferase MnmD [Bacteroidia bacterium]|nr:tRNA (5-methylaminomethyl-2-thiouridine)(34)-methyltransferase MnmD [Bacteroidia bacterium]
MMQTHFQNAVNIISNHPYFKIYLDPMELQETKTGEYTLYIPSMDETYHSRNGAISESRHVFLQEGLDRTIGNIRVLEVGFGTGLNAILAAQYATQHQRKIHFHTFEPFQVPFDLISQIGYGQILEDQQLFEQLHAAEWETPVSISEYFIIHKTTQKLEYVSLTNEHYDCIFFDAFAPKKQPELWEIGIFSKLYAATRPNGVLTTYSAAGQLKRNLKAAGYSTEHPPGANGKREMTVAMR